MLTESLIVRDEDLFICRKDWPFHKWPFRDWPPILY